MRKQVLVSVDRAETRVALLEAAGTPGASRPAGRSAKRSGARPGAGYRIAELYIERRGGRSIVGNIYKGKVDNVLPGLEAAFVDIGLEKNGFLHVDEIVLPGVEAPKRGRGGGRKISELLQPGQEIVVQVVKDPLKTKGARLSMELTIAGRYMVYAPTGEGIGVSRRLEDKERERLRRQTAKLEIGQGGAIIRTAAHGAQRADFERELLYLHKLHEVLMKRVEETQAPAMVFQEADLSVRVVRDIFSEHFERAIVDDEQQHRRLVSFFARTAPELVERVELWEGPVPLLDAYKVTEAIDGVMSRRVDLPSGGYLMIDYAEALTVIDVNSGSFIGRGKGAGLEETITKTNLEAAEEVVNQLRLRDIGGIIVIDFIDMARARNRDAVMKTLRKALDEDRTKTFTAELSRLGLVEMTRQNVTEGVREIMSRPCPTCEGEGVIRSEETIAIEFERRLRDLVVEHPDAEAFLVQINPRVTSQFTGQGSRVLHALEAQTGRSFHFEGSEGLALDHFAITFQGTREEVEERALPFREGDEVLVDIVEPHMYDVDDAVAKLDGYIISIAGAARNVGEKRMVRIETVGRTAASALLLDESGEVIRPAPRPAARPAAKRTRRRAKPAVRVTAGGSEPSGEQEQEQGASGDGDSPARTTEKPPRESELELVPSDSRAAAEESGDEGGEDDLQSKPRRRGRRGGRRRSAAKAQATSE
ncbi:MAG TPA: Rne/Rng family ribonuclease [Solirubrobacteraceae bacterium]|nr:Rne/Rng family ribonuclease [Solirubrobacteraceae bacterium]